jgi:hypothetical protein
MKTISVRDLRGKSLAADARQGVLVGITNYRVLIGVLVPVTAAWVEHLIDYNWSRVRQSIDESEQEAATDTPAVTLDAMLIDIPDDPGGLELAKTGDSHLRLAAAAASAIGALTGHAGLSGVAEQLCIKVVQPLQMAMAAPGYAGSAGPGDAPSVHTVRVGDVSAALIEEAGRNGQTLALTHDRVLLGIVIPVTPGLVQFLIEQNMSRVLYNIAVGEKENTAGEPFTTLDQVTSPAPAAGLPVHGEHPSPGIAPPEPTRVSVKPTLA